MKAGNLFFRSIGVNPGERSSISDFASRSGVPRPSLIHYNSTNTLPSGRDLEAICSSADITPKLLMLRMGILDRKMLKLLVENAEAVHQILTEAPPPKPEPYNGEPVFTTSLGSLYHGDCISVMRALPSESVDLVFADPPFNLAKIYPSGIDDDLDVHRYLEWCEGWLDECVRLLRPGGSLFLWNLPKWNAQLASYLNARLTFRHWIAVDIKYSLPISGRLYPAHYSLLYYCKGEKPRVFHPDRLPLEVCPACNTELKDYGGYKQKLNGSGINMMDVWKDIPPVRHAKYKHRTGANELPLRLLDRVIELASDPGDMIFDPFGGAGTTYIAAELKQRRWIGAEIGDVRDIVERFKSLDEQGALLDSIRANYNHLFPAKVRSARIKRGLWVNTTSLADS